LAINYNPKIITDNLVLCLDAANPKSYPGSGTTWTDLSGRGNTGTLVNGVGYVGTNGGALSFDGVNDYVNCGNNSSLSFTNKLTIQIWCSLNVYSEYSNPLMKTTNNNWNDGYGFYVEANRFYFYINLWDGAHRVSVSKTTFPLTNFVGTYDGANLKLYENGILQQTGSSYASNVSNSATALLIGRGALNDPYYWNGRIPQVSIYNRALSASEITQNYNATKSRYGL
jgi:hypothetical protein